MCAPKLDSDLPLDVDHSMCVLLSYLMTTFRRRSLYVCAPKLYNDLPLNVGHSICVLLSYTMTYL